MRPATFRVRKLLPLARVAACSPSSVLHARRAISSFGAIQRTYELATTLRVVRQLRPQVVLEIGSHRGGTLYAWSTVAAADALIITVDIPFAGSSGLASPRRLVRGRQRIEHVSGDSHDESTLAQVRRRLAGEPVDFLFIDGDHLLDGVKKDFGMYGPLVRNGGTIGFHDIIRNDAAPDDEVWKLWQELRGTTGALEIADADACRDGGMGIGLITMTEQLRNECACQTH